MNQISLPLSVALGVTLGFFASYYFYGKPSNARKLRVSFIRYYQNIQEKFAFKVYFAFFCISALALLTFFIQWRAFIPSGVIVFLFFSWIRLHMRKDSEITDVSWQRYKFDTTVLAVVLFATWAYPWINGLVTRAEFFSGSLTEGRFEFRAQSQDRATNVTVALGGPTQAGPSQESRELQGQYLARVIDLITPDFARMQEFNKDRPIFFQIPHLNIRPQDSIDRINTRYIDYVRRKLSTESISICNIINDQISFRYINDLSPHHENIFGSGTRIGFYNEYYHQILPISSRIGRDILNSSGFFILQQGNFTVNRASNQQNFRSIAEFISSFINMDVESICGTIDNQNLHQMRADLIFLLHIARIAQCYKGVVTRMGPSNIHTVRLQHLITYLADMTGAQRPEKRLNNEPVSHFLSTLFMQNLVEMQQSIGVDGTNADEFCPASFVEHFSLVQPSNVTPYPTMAMAYMLTALQRATRAQLLISEWVSQVLKDDTQRLASSTNANGRSLSFIFTQIDIANLSMDRLSMRAQSDELMEYYLASTLALARKIRMPQSISWVSTCGVHNSSIWIEQDLRQFSYRSLHFIIATNLLYIGQKYLEQFVYESSNRHVEIIRSYSADFLRRHLFHNFLLLASYARSGCFRGVPLFDTNEDLWMGVFDMMEIASRVIQRPLGSSGSGVGSLGADAEASLRRFVRLVDEEASVETRRHDHPGRARSAVERDGVNWSIARDNAVFLLQHMIAGRGRGG